MAAPKDKQAKGTDPGAIEQRPDGWERFETAVDAAVKTKPKSKPAKKSAAKKPAK